MSYQRKNCANTAQNVRNTAQFEDLEWEFLDENSQDRELLTQVDPTPEPLYLQDAVKDTAQTVGNRLGRIVAGVFHLVGHVLIHVLGFVCALLVAIVRGVYSYGHDAVTRKTDTTYEDDKWINEYDYQNHPTRKENGITINHYYNFKK